MVTAVRFMCLVDRNVDSPRVVAPNGKSRKMGVSAVARRGACGVPAQNSSTPSRVVVIASHEMTARGFWRRFVDSSFGVMSSAEALLGL